MLPEDMPITLPAACREIKDDGVKVSLLRAAIKEGQLTATVDPFLPGRQFVTLRAVRKWMVAPKPEPKPKPKPKKLVVKKTKDDTKTAPKHAVLARRSKDLT